MGVTSETSSSEEEGELMLLLALEGGGEEKEKMWVLKIFSSRRAQAEYSNVLQEMRLSDQESHVRYLRISR